MSIYHKSKVFTNVWAQLHHYFNTVDKFTGFDQDLNQWYYQGKVVDQAEYERYQKLQAFE